jgi:hypothetical protein
MRHVSSGRNLSERDVDQAGGHRAVNALTRGTLLVDVASS